jgi:hypothetical protein
VLLFGTIIYMKLIEKLNKTMRLEDNMRSADLVLIIVPLMILSPLVVSLFSSRDSTYEHAGPGFADDSVGWVGGVVGMVMLLFLFVMIATGITRIIYRFTHSKKS